MLALFIAAILHAQITPAITRDTFGVAHVYGPNWEEAFYMAGYATAQDRLWQMELSRRLSLGQMAEVFGPKMAASDKEVLSLAYTKDELDKQFSQLSPKVQSAFRSYASGVNAYIHKASESGQLPAGYKENGFEPREWTVEDSVAISVRLLQLFGRGGAGELRDLALFKYLQTRPNLKGRELDVLDDIAWQNEPRALTTMPRGEDPQAGDPPLRVDFTRKQTEEQLAALPKMNLFELLPAIQLSEQETSRKVAERLGVPYRTGSYCVVVGPGRSATGAPLLLSGPQMGHSNPAIIHEMSIDAPDLHVAGMDVPGAPGIVVGMTGSFAWGLTSGVADTEDIFNFKTDATGNYLFGGKTFSPEAVTFTLKIKGQPDQTVTQTRTMFGPVVLKARDSLFVRRSAYWGAEMKSVDAYYGLYDAKTPDEIERTLSGSSMNFNFFYATNSGHIGWMYTGKIPIRALGIDPRLPTPATPANNWQGFLTEQQLPHIRDPKAGLLANWNNKPVAWWPNFDTPVWGRIFHNEVLLEQLAKPKLTSQDLELAAWNIARLDETAPYFMPYANLIQAGVADAESASELKSFDGRSMAGSLSAPLYSAWIKALRSALFEPSLGNFYSPDLFQTVVQPSLMLKAMEHKTALDYLDGRSAQAIASAAFAKSLEDLRHRKGEDMAGWGLMPGSFEIPGEAPVPYSNRGSYIQIIELLSIPYGRNILPPGESETGDHSKDQAPMARAWTYKPMTFIPIVRP